MNIDSTEISEYVAEVLKGVINGVSPSGGFFLSSPIKFTIGVQNITDGEGSLRVVVAAVGAERSQSRVRGR